MLLGSVTDHIKVEHGILNAFNNSKYKYLFDITPYRVTTTDKIHAKVVAGQLLQHAPDLIITVRQFCTQAVAELAKRQAPHIPIVFADLPDADKLGLINSPQVSDTNVTGIQVGDPAPLTLARHLYRIKSTIKKLLIPYDISYDTACPGNPISSWARATKQFLAQHGVSTTIAAFDNARDALIKLPSMLLEHDTLIYYEGGDMKTVYTGLIKLCNKAGITLFTATRAAAEE